MTKNTKNTYYFFGIDYGTVSFLKRQQYIMIVRPESHVTINKMTNVTNKGLPARGVSAHGVPACRVTL